MPLRFSALVFCLLALPAFAQAPLVVSTAPSGLSLTAAPSDPIELTFDKALDPATVTAASVRVFGRWSGPATGTLSLDEGDTVIRFVPDAPFFSGEAVSVSLSKEVGAASGEALAGYAFGFWVRAAAGSLDLVEIGQLSTRQPGETINIISYGAYGGDLNDDGWSDLAIPNEATNDLRVFLNDGTGSYADFVVHPLPESSFPSTNEGADFNEDGLLDLAVGNIGNDRVSLMLGDGTGNFLSETSTVADQSVRGLCVLDLDYDGHDDIVTANRNANNITMLMGNGDGTFDAPVALNTGAFGETACAVADANGDGFADVFVGAFTSQSVITLLGDGAGGLTVGGSVELGTSPWMLAAGDIDGDGFADVAAAGAAVTNGAVAYGDGTGGFSGVDTFDSGFFAVAVDLGDPDGDGDLDVLISNYGSRDYKLYENTGARAFAEPRVFETVPDGNGSCAVFHDVDNDGDLDMTGVDEGADMLYFFENPGQPTSTEAVPDAALDVALFPNPTQDAATLRFTLDAPGRVVAQVYDALGRHVATVADGTRGAGPQTVRWSTRDLPSGVYVVRLNAGGVLATPSFVVTR